MKSLDKPSLKSIVIDGSTTSILKARLAVRIKKVLATAKERKLNGIGVMARPEADIGLLPLYQVLHRLEPDRGWLEKALVTLAHTLFDCLSNPQEIWWGETWKYLGEPCGNVPPPNLLEECESQRSGSEIILKLAPLVRQYLQLANEISERSFENGLALQSIPALPEISIEPEWKNPRFPPKWPNKEKAKQAKLGRVLTVTMRSWWREAWYVYHYGPKILAGEVRPHGTQTDWLHSVTTFDRVSAKFAEASYLDRVFGGSAKDFLSALLGYSRYEHSQEIWSDRVAYFNAHVPNALATNDQAHLQNWALTVQRSKLPLSAGIGQMLLRIILQRDDINISPLGKSGSSYFKAEYLATQGLLERELGRIEEGLAGMLASYYKTNYAVWKGNWLSEICVPAVAIQRAAIRSGMKIKIPAERPNDSELAQLPDPAEARLPFCLYPGIETILSRRKLAWPALLLDEPIAVVVE